MSGRNEPSPPSVATWVLGLEPPTLEIDPVGRQLLGFAPSEPLDGGRLWRLVHPQDQLLHGPRLHRAFWGRQPVVAELHFETATGWLPLRLVGGFDSVRQSWVGTAELGGFPLSQANPDLLQDLRVFRLVLDSVSVGVQVMDREGNMVLANPAAQQIWGRIVEAGEQRYRAVHARWRDSGRPILPHEWASVRARLHGEVVLNEVIEIEAFDGRQRVIRNSARPIRDGDGSILGAVVTNDDITERLSLESQLLQSQKMEAVGRLAAGAAHDFNNLLTVISGCSELLFDDLQGDPEKQGLLSEIRVATERAAALTGQLLTFSRQSLVELRVLGLHRLLSDHESMLARLLGEEIVFTLKLEGPDCCIRIDPSQFTHVLLNLIVNARDSMPAGGRLTLSCRPSPRAGWVEVVVADTGHGMSRVVMDRIFEPFFTTKPQGSGTGLGLSTVYGIVTQCGGEVSVESEVGVGSCFTLRFPTVEPLLVPAVRSTEAGPVTGSEAVLLVEDQPEVRSFLRRVISRAGYQVSEAGSGKEALELLRESGQGVELLLTDVVMPEMSGVELAERVRRERPSCRVVFMSGYNDDEVLRRAVNRSELAFLAKPFTAKSLLQKIREVLDAP